MSFSVHGKQIWVKWSKTEEIRSKADQLHSLEMYGASGRPLY